MNRRFNAFHYLTIKQFVITIYFITTTVIYFIALEAGNEGVSIRLFGGGDDGYFYLEQSRNVAEGREAILTSIHPFILGKITQLLGFESVYAFRMFNYMGFLLLLSFALIVLKKLYQSDSSIYFFHKKMLYYKSASLLVIMYMVYPSLITNVTLSIYRDVWIYAFYILSLLFAIKFVASRTFIYKICYIILMIISLTALGSFRKYAVLSFVLASGIFFLYHALKKIGVRFSHFIIFITIVFVVYFTFFKDWTVPYVNMSFSDVLRYREYFLTIAPGGSQMHISLNHSNVILFLLNYIYSYIGNLIGPLPWQITGFGTLVVFCTETLPFLLILMIFYKSRKRLSSLEWFLLSHGFIWNALISVSNDNIGAGTRLRAVGWLVFFIIFVKVYVQNRYDKSKYVINCQGKES